MGRRIKIANSNLFIKVTSKNFWLIITIDGPVASGKGLLTKLVAEMIDVLQIDSGAIYRCVAYNCLEEGIDIKNEDLVKKSLENLDVDEDLDTSTRTVRITINGNDVSQRIRTPKVSEGSSIVAVYKDVREFCTETQRKIAKGKSIVVDGRDTGSIVFPNADLKIYLDADPKIRAERRLKDYENQGYEKSLEEILEETLTRDERDKTREYAPLIKPEGSFYIDSSNLTPDEVLMIVIEELQKRNLLTIPIIEREIVSALISSKDGKILMGRKDVNDKSSVYPDCWHIPGGGIEKGESELETLKREIFEETGINIENQKAELVSKDRAITKRQKDGKPEIVKMNLNVYIVDLQESSDQIRFVPNDDLIDLRWLEKKELGEVKLTPPSEKLFRKLGFLN